MYVTAKNWNSVVLKRPTSYSTLSDNLVEILLNHENATAAFKLR